MTHHKRSASTPPSASILLPSAEVIQLPTARRRRADPGTFTKATVRSMQCPAGQAERFFWDMGCRGFGIRALKSGRRSWLYQYRDEHGRTRRIVLGDVSAVTLENARDAARRTAATVAHGGNPSVERKKKRTAGAVLEIIDAYLHHAGERLRVRSYKETKRHLRVHAAPLHHERAETISRRDITALLDRIAKRSGPVASNRVRATLSALWTWALRTGLIEGDRNPVAFTVRYPEKPRERVLADAELKAIWGATGDSRHYSRVVRLCLLTGCRRVEIAGLRWDEVQADRIVIAANRMKGSRRSRDRAVTNDLGGAAAPPEPRGRLCAWQARHRLLGLRKVQARTGCRNRAVRPASTAVGTSRPSANGLNKASRCGRGAARHRGSARPQTAGRGGRLQPCLLPESEARSPHALA